LVRGDRMAINLSDLVSTVGKFILRLLCRGSADHR
jgi:hypothetical protein